jgi:uncharacterized protein with PQ loop repeat
MLSHHLIGEITLSVSSVIYFIWFLPQLWLNFKRKNTDGLSLWMHGLLLLGYSADLLYGFGRHMQWQYRAVTIVGLICLCVQHIQFARFGLHTRVIKNNFIFLTALVVIVFLYALLNFTLFHHGKKYYDMAGFVSSACWMTFLFPQMIKNFRLQSTEGLSNGFVELAILLSLLDLTSAMMLHWDLPSLINPCVSLLKKSVLVFQILYYRKKGLVREPISR